MIRFVLVSDVDETQDDARLKSKDEVERQVTKKEHEQEKQQKAKIQQE